MQPWLAKLGSNIYDLLLAANPYINWFRRKLNLPHWSLSMYLKHKAKTAVQYIGSFEEAVAQAARKRGVDTVVCGHIHHAEIRDIDGIRYCNDGDWVESCTSLVEDMNGQLRLIDWPKLRSRFRINPLRCARTGRLRIWNERRLRYLEFALAHAHRSARRAGFGRGRAPTNVRREAVWQGSAMPVSRGLARSDRRLPKNEDEVRSNSRTLEESRSCPSIVTLARQD